MSSQQRLVKTDQILEAVRAFRKVRDHEIAQKEKKSIIDEDDRQERFVNLQLTVKKMSACQKILMIPFTFPHCLLTEEDEICFIVGCKDSEKGNKRADHERYANEWKHKLRTMGIDREIHVMPVMQLETEFKSYEAKRKLCKAFDHFLCDHRIMFKMPKLLGTLFFRRRKMPIRVYIKDEDKLKQALEEAITRTLIHITPEGPNVSMKVGNLTDHSDQEITDNIRAILDSFIPEHLPGGEANVNSIHLASFVGKSVPMYVSFVSANSVDMSEIDKVFIDRQTPKEFEDTIDTMPGVRVKIRTDGKVIAIKDEEQKLDSDDLLDEDYLEVFRNQEFEERDEAKKRYIKHLARKAALRKVGKRFGSNMLKLPSHVPVPKPKALPKQVKMPKQSKPPAVPAFDTLQGYDDAEYNDNNDDKGDVEECPQLVPIEKKSEKIERKFDQMAAIKDKVAKSEKHQGFKVSKQSAATTLRIKLGRAATSEFTLTGTPRKSVKKVKRNSNFLIEPRTAKQKTLKGRETQSVAKSIASTPNNNKQSDEANTPRPILKSPRESLGKEKRKSVTFDFTPAGKLASMKTPKDGDPTPVYFETPSTDNGKASSRKRKSVAGGFELTPMHGANKLNSAKKAKRMSMK
ncbi:putative ribosome biogenesis protein C8F11.04 [Varroa destructor]|uniref:Ribosomal protein L1 n=1 Tax=Varroa destructor TaxID=109461 RepID=A0A7M7M6B7_VARDE|nr:putative ribosome biogenesis protein C8F11.04 [Varroa destructor]